MAKTRKARKPFEQMIRCALTADNKIDITRVAPEDRQSVLIVVSAVARGEHLRRR